MHIARSRRWLAVALALALLGCGGEPPGAAKAGHGVIRGLDAQAATVTLEHGEIRGLMMAMTMTFSVEDPATLTGLSVGDEVDFLVRQQGERLVVTGIRRAP